MFVPSLQYDPPVEVAQHEVVAHEIVSTWLVLDDGSYRVVVSAPLRSIILLSIS